VGTLVCKSFVEVPVLSSHNRNLLLLMIAVANSLINGSIGSCSHPTCTRIPTGDWLWSFPNRVQYLHRSYTLFHYTNENNDSFFMQRYSPMPKPQKREALVIMWMATENSFYCECNDLYTLERLRLLTHASCFTVTQLQGLDAVGKLFENIFPN